jgi:hypothetical protein
LPKSNERNKQDKTKNSQSAKTQLNRGSVFGRRSNDRRASFRIDDFKWASYKLDADRAITLPSKFTVAYLKVDSKNKNTTPVYSYEFTVNELLFNQDWDYNVDPASVDYIFDVDANKMIRIN